MAHRGRLNVLVNMLGKMPKDLFSRVRRQARRRSCRRATSSTTRASRRTSSTPGGPVHLTLAFNPSHLEIVNPVVEGSVRARQHRRGDTTRRPGAAGADPRRRGVRRAGRGDGDAEHGADARLLHRRHGAHRRQQPDRLHHVGPARRALARLYCTDIAKMVEAPIFHVNGDDPEACAARDRARARLPAAVPQGRGHRPRLLPPARPQRAGRADGDAAADVQEDRAASGHAQALRRQAGRRRA